MKKFIFESTFLIVKLAKKKRKSFRKSFRNNEEKFCTVQCK